MTRHRRGIANFIRMNFNDLLSLIDADDIDLTDVRNMKIGLIQPFNAKSMQFFRLH